MSDTKKGRPLIMPNHDANARLDDMRQVLSRLVAIVPLANQKIVARAAERVFDEAVRALLPSIGVPQGLREEEEHD